MMLDFDCCCHVHLRLRRCTAVAAVIDTDFISRDSVAGEPTSYETLTSEGHRVRMLTFALMHSMPLFRPLFARPCSCHQQGIERCRCHDRQAAAELMGALQCSKNSDALPSCRHDAAVASRWLCGNRFLSASRQSCMAQCLLMCLDSAVPVGLASSRTVEKPFCLALTS